MSASLCFASSFLPSTSSTSIRNGICKHRKFLPYASAETPFAPTKSIPDKIEPPIDSVSTTETTFLDSSAFSTSAAGIASDVKSRPVYYASAAAALFAVFVLLDIASSVLNAVEAIPVLPDVFRLIGLAYSLWFIWRYLFYEDIREQFLETISQLLERATS